MSNPLDMQNLSAFIFDLDGVVWRGDTPISGVPEAIMQLKAAGKKCLYCTNNAAKKPSDYVEKLAEMGIEAEEDEVMTSAVATAIYLASQLTGQFSAYVVGEDGLTSALQKVGARVVTMSGLAEGSELVVENSAFPVDCVVAGIDRNFSYEKLCQAQNFILGGAQFIATNRDATFPVAEGVVPGAGAIVSAIETASGVAPLTIGKPQALMLILLMQKFNLDKDTTVMVGDRLETDIVAAHRAEIKAIWVESGVATREKAEKAKGQQKPDAMFRDVVELCAAALEGHSGTAVATSGIPTLVESETVATEAVATEILAAPENAAPINVTSDVNAASDVAAEAVVATSPQSASDDVFSLNGASNGSASHISAADAAEKPAVAQLQSTEVISTESAAPASPYSFAEADEEAPAEVAVEPTSSPFAFSLDDSASSGADGSSTPRMAPHLAAPALSSSASAPATSVSSPAASAPAVSAPAASATAVSATGSGTNATAGKEAKAPAPITPGVNTDNVSSVDEPLDNWWESIEDAFKKK